MKPADVIVRRPENSVELVDQRTGNTKRLRLEDKSERLIIVQGPIHYQDDANDWQEIDLEPQVARNGYSLTTTPYLLEVNTDEIGFTYTSRKGGVYKAKLVALNGTRLANVVGLTKTPSVDVDGNIHWDSLLPELDIYLMIRSGGVEFYKVLKGASAPVEMVWEIEHDDPLPLKRQAEPSGRDADKNLVRMTYTETPLAAAVATKKFELSERFEGQSSKITDPKTRIRGWVDEFVYPVIIDMPDVTEDIVANVDDGSARAGHRRSDSYLLGPGTFDYDGGYIYPGYGGNETDCWSVNRAVQTAPVSFSYGQAGGVRFRTLPIGTGQTIAAARLIIQVKVVEDSRATLSIPDPHIKCEDPQGVYSQKWYYQFSWPEEVNYAPGLANLLLGTGTATWATPAVGTNTIDVKTIVQNVLARSGTYPWVSNQHMKFVIGVEGVYPNLEGTHASYGASQAIRVYDYKKGQSFAAVLEIDFAVASDPATEFAGTLAESFDPSTYIPKKEVVEY